MPRSSKSRPSASDASTEGVPTRQRPPCRAHRGQSPRRRPAVSVQRGENPRRKHGANAGPVGRNGRHADAVSRVQFAAGLDGSPRHAGEVFVLAEKGLHGDPRGLAGGGGDRHQFLGFDRLVQAVLPFASLHLAAGRFVDDDDLVVDDDIIAVALKAESRREGLFHVLVHPLAVDAVQQRRLGHQQHFAAAVVGEIGRCGDRARRQNRRCGPAAGRPAGSSASRLTVGAVLGCVRPIMSGVRASSMRMLSPSSTSAK